MEKHFDFVVLISADAEWRAVKKNIPYGPISISPYGEWFSYKFGEYKELSNPVIFMHGGWGKVAAAASTQYAIREWSPRLVINLGTCGGFSGLVNHNEIILVNRTVIYDIFEQMGDPAEHLRYYMTEIDNSWIMPPYPIPVRESLLVSADRDLFVDDIPELKVKFNAIAGDWESGAIAWVAQKNHVPCLMLRGVTDLVGESGGEAYNGNVNFYYEKTEVILKKLIDSLPLWLLKFVDNELQKKLTNNYG